jgi:hypothetical protein
MVLNRMASSDFTYDVVNHGKNDQGRQMCPYQCYIELKTCTGGFSGVLNLMTSSVFTYDVAILGKVTKVGKSDFPNVILS